MGDRSREDIARLMREIEFAMFMTYAPGGQIAGRPMCINKDVDFRGDMYFFTRNISQMVRDIERNTQVTLGLQGRPGMWGRAGVLITVQGVARVIRDRQHFKDHWYRAAQRWFRQGIDSPGLVMIRVQAKRVTYWDGNEAGEVPLV